MVSQGQLSTPWHALHITIASALRQFLQLERYLETTYEETFTRRPTNASIVPASLIAAINSWNTKCYAGLRSWMVTEIISNGNFQQKKAKTGRRNRKEMITQPFPMRLCNVFYRDNSLHREKNGLQIPYFFRHYEERCRNEQNEP